MKIWDYETIRQLMDETGLTASEISEITRAEVRRLAEAVVERQEEKSK